MTDLAVGYAREYLPNPVGLALLAEVAAVTGGRVLTDPVSAAAWEATRNGSRELALWWLFVMLALVVFAAAASSFPVGFPAGLPRAGGPAADSGQSYGGKSRCRTLRLHLVPAISHRRGRLAR